MSRYDNAAPLAGWSVPPGKHCGQMCVDRACPVCGNIRPAVPPNVTVGEN